jgi:HEPN domain-containing protein
MSDQTREAIKQWLAKAESDWTTIEILMASARCPAETVCFHCQQYVEKLLKAFLTLEGIEAPKTHDLRRLIQLASPSEPKLMELTEESDALTVHGVQSRYPGDFWLVETAEMNRLYELSKKFADILLPRLKK